MRAPSVLLPDHADLAPADPAPAEAISTPWAPEALLDLVLRTAADDTAWRSAVRFDARRRHWSRLPSPAGAELWLLTWLPDQATDLHDHGPSAAALTVVQGRLEEVRATADGTRTSAVLGRGSAVHLAPGVVHDVGNRGTAPAVSVHGYSPPLTSMTFYETSPTGLHAVRSVAGDEPEQA